MFRDAVDPSLEAAGKTFCAFAALHRAESRCLPAWQTPPSHATALFFTPRHKTSRGRLSGQRDRHGKLEGDMAGLGDGGSAGGLATE